MNKRKKILIAGLLLLQMILIPASIILPYTSDWRFDSLTGPVSITVLTLLLVILIWSRRIVEVKNRGRYLLAQLISSLFILGPTLWLYGLAHDAALQQLRLNFLLFENGGVGKYPALVDNYFTNHWNIHPGLSPSSVVYIYLLVVLVPAIGCYTHYLSKKHYKGIKKKELFQ